MLVITDVKYDVHEDKHRGEYLEYALPAFEPVMLLPPKGYLPDWSLRTERVIPRTYVFTLPKQDVEYSNRVKALKEFGLEIDDVSNYNSDALIKCSIQIGVVGSRDENVVLTILKLLQESSDIYLQKMMEANQAANRSAKQMTEANQAARKWSEHAANLTKQSDAVFRDVARVRDAPFWQRLKWLFTGVKI